MKITKYLIAILGVAAMWSCSEEEFTTYQPGTVGSGSAKAGICIQSVYTTTIDGTILSFRDSVSMSYASQRSTVTDYPINVPVSVMGDLSNKDRAFKLVVDTAQSTAIRGVHFDYADSLCFIPAGKAKQNVTIVLHRHNDLLKQMLKIVVRLEPNENFTTPLKDFKEDATWNSTSKKTLDATRYVITFSELLNQPSYWTSQGISYFGTWSAIKEKLVNEVLGWLHSDWNYAGFSGYPVQLGKFPYVARKLREKLQAAADAGEPICEEDGTYMQLAGDYVIDYSQLMN